MATATLPQPVSARLRLAMALCNPTRRAPPMLAAAEPITVRMTGARVTSAARRLRERLACIARALPSATEPGGIRARMLWPWQADAVRSAAERLHSVRGCPTCGRAHRYWGSLCVDCLMAVLFV